VFSERKVSLLFTEGTVGPITVRLIAEDQPNSCFPEDDGVDTVEYTFRVIPWSESPLIGRYQGAFASQPDDQEQIVEVRYISVEEDPAEGPFGAYDLINIDPGCQINPQFEDADVWNSISRGAKKMNFNAFNGGRVYYNNCRAPNAWLYLQGADSLVVDFSNGEAPGSDIRYDDQFVGVRIRE